MTSAEAGADGGGQDKRATIALLALAACASMASMRVCDPMLPQLAHRFGTSTGGAASTVSAFAIAYGISQLAYGPLADRYGKYRVATFATLACTLSNLAAALAPTLPVLTLARAVSGITGAGIIPIAMAWIGDNVSYDRRQATLARLMTGTVLGIAGGQLIGGVVADTVGWRFAFGLLAVAFLVAGIRLFAKLPENAARESAAAARVGTSGARGVVAGYLDVLRVPWARRVLATVFVEGMVMFGAIAFVPAFLHVRFGLSLSAAGAILALFGLGGFVYTLLARRLVQRLGEHGLARTGGLLGAIAFALLAVTPSWPLALPVALLSGTGFYMLHNTLQTNATQMVPSARGTALSTFALALFLGQSCGVLMGGALFDAGWTRQTFLVAASGFGLLGLAFGRLLIRRVKG